MSVPIAVVSFGHKEHDRLMQEFINLDEPFYVYYDLRKMISDPLRQDRVNHREDGSHAKTIVAVFGQQSFANVVAETLSGALAQAESLGRGVVIAGGCNGGFHRADTWGRTLVDSFNALMVGPAVRLVNAQHFPLQTASQDEAKYILDDAKKWAAMPWTMITATSPHVR